MMKIRRRDVLGGALAALMVPNLAMAEGERVEALLAQVEGLRAVVWPEAMGAGLAKVGLSVDAVQGLTADLALIAGSQQLRATERQDLRITRAVGRAYVHAARSWRSVSQTFKRLGDDDLSAVQRAAASSPTLAEDAARALLGEQGDDPALRALLTELLRPAAEGSAKLALRDADAARRDVAAKAGLGGLSDAELDQALDAVTEEEADALGAAVMAADSGGSADANFWDLLRTSNRAMFIYGLISVLAWGSVSLLLGLQFDEMNEYNFPIILFPFLITATMTLLGIGTLLVSILLGLGLLFAPRGE